MPRKVPMNFKVFNDAVHGHMSFPSIIVKIIDTPEFQRLRYIKQTGLAYYVYPSACHNRFEHSLGTCQLAGLLLDALCRFDGIVISNQDKLCVQIAGLCHDVGHGPFSHTWERFLAKNGVQWKHEHSSIEIFDRIILNEDVAKEMLENGLGENEVEVIRNIILGNSSQATPENHFLYQIVNNKDNDIDVDKWDYVLRDKALLNLTVNFDHKRLLEFCQVMWVTRNGVTRREICFRDKEVPNLLDMFITRATLHYKAYQHHVVKVLESMLIDVFCLVVEGMKTCPSTEDRANNPFNLNLLDTSVDNLLLITDHIYYLIKTSCDSRLNAAKALIKRIESRKLYSIIFNYEWDDTIPLKEQNLEDAIHLALSNNNAGLKRSDIAVNNITLDMGSAFRSGETIDVFIFRKFSKRPEKLKKTDVNHIFAAALNNQVLRKELLVLYKGTIGKDFNKDLIGSVIEDYEKRRHW